MVEVLHEEIIFDILTRLPAKSIGQFRCVSKRFNHLLCQPHFIKAHLNQIKQYPCRESLFLISSDVFTCSLSNAHELFDEMTISATSLDFEVEPETWLEDIPSCNGLVFIRNKAEKLFVLNPITKEIRELPVSPYALDPRASFTMYGLGYDQVNDDYKVVTLSYYDSDNEHEPDCTEMFVNVYSIRNGAWKKAESSPYDHSVGYLRSGVYVDGSLHWLASSTSDFSSVIVGFDLAEEKFYEVPAPSAVDMQKFVFDHLVVLEGCLCMFPNRTDWEIDVWVMKEYDVKESWTKLTLTDPKKAEFRPICMLGESELLVVKDEETVAEKLVTFNLDDGRCRVVQVNGIADDFHVAGTFMESLISPFYN